MRELGIAGGFDVADAGRVRDEGDEANACAAERTCAREYLTDARVQRRPGGAAANLRLRRGGRLRIEAAGRMEDVSAHPHDRQRGAFADLARRPQVPAPRFGRAATAAPAPPAEASAMGGDAALADRAREAVVITLPRAAGAMSS